MITVQGVDVLRLRVASLASAFPEQSADVLLKRVTVEVRSREQLSWRRQLDIEGDGLSVRVLWPYAYEGGVGTYLTSVTESASALMMDGLSKDLSGVVEGAL